MNIEKRSVWQQAAGDTKRNYVDICLKWDVILNGPTGIYGSWPECQEKMRNDGCSAKKITDLKRFCEDIQDKDFVVLRLGTRDVYGVGEIVGDYEYHEEFNDIDEWDIAHIRRVRWIWKYSQEPKGFNTYSLKLGDTTQRLSRDAYDVKEWLNSLQIPENFQNQEPRPLPQNYEYESFNLEQISEYLFGEGVSSASISNLMNKIGELIRIAKWYWGAGQNPSEHETVNFLVVPLLRTLGWTPQKMGIEWHRMDVALFAKLPREQDSLSAVVEVKKMDEPLLPAFDQAKTYAGNYEQCKRVILTDGLRYLVFARGGGSANKKVGEFSQAPIAYLNLIRLRPEYPLYECKGAKEALLSMAPEWTQT